MEVALVLAVCLNHGDLAHRCCLDLGCLPLPRLLPHRGYHGLWSMHVGMPWAMCPQGLLLPWLLAHWRVIFPNQGFFQNKIFSSKEVIWASQHA